MYKMVKRYKLAILDTHPIHYAVPMYKLLSKHPKIDLMVYFLCKINTKKHFDPQFNCKIDRVVPLKGLKYKFLKNHSIKSAFPPKGLLNLGIIPEIFKNKYDALLVSTYPPTTNKIAILIAKLSGTPIILKEEIDFLNRPPKGIKGFIKNILFKIVLKRLDAFLYTYTLNADFYRYYGVPEEKLFFHPCSVNNEFFQKEYKRLKKVKEDTKKRLGIPKKNKVILFLAKLISIKRPKDLLRAYENMPNKDNISLLFVGEGSERECLERYAKEKKLKNVEFYGYKKEEQIPDFYSIADIYVLPSEEDRSPKALNEAMNFSLPIITTDKVATARDLIKEGQNGFIFKSGDITSLRKHLITLIKNADLRKKMGKKSLEIVSKWNFNEDVKSIIAAVEYVKQKNKNGKNKAE